MTSDVAFPSRFTKIDGLTRPDYYWLVEDDRCFFLGEYTARHGYAYSPTNNLILNFKKTLDRCAYRKPRPPIMYIGHYWGSRVGLLASRAMRTVCLVMFTALGSGLQSQAALQIENAALRHQ